MSTRATIGLKRPNGTIDTIICWHDAYFDGAGRILKNRYDTEEKIEKLMAGGNVEELQPTPRQSIYQYQGDDAVPEDCRAQTLRNTDRGLYAPSPRILPRLRLPLPRRAMALLPPRRTTDPHAAIAATGSRIVEE